MNRPDVIVVLGAAAMADGSPSPAMRRRVKKGVELYCQGLAPHLLLTGGPVRHARPEAEVMAGIAIEAGVPATSVIIEAAARNTYENALYSREIIRARGWTRPLVVSDPFHLPRALFVFRRLGMAAEGAAVGERSGEPLWRWYMAHLREVLAFARSAAIFLVSRT